ncbi:MAG: hypothetical protein KA715_07050 [Xanthomonadaceae bacterium]|nr:hypothetical protein [Xanthomonadaceae bacterium]
MSTANGYIFNERQDSLPQTLKHRDHVLVEFPDERFEAVVFQWDHTRPTVVVQLKLDAEEPIQFPKKRPKQAGNAEMPDNRYPVLTAQVPGVVNPMKAVGYADPLYRADLVFSERAFRVLQPEDGYVIPLDNLAELRGEAIKALGLTDQPGF